MSIATLRKEVATTMIFVLWVRAARLQETRRSVIE
jgi:hypothetical protein